MPNASSGLFLLSAAAAAANCRDESSTEAASSHRRVSDRCDDGGLSSSSFASSSLSLSLPLPSSSVSSPASHPSSLSKLPLKKRLKSAFRSPPQGEEASLSFSGRGGGGGTPLPRDDVHDDGHGVHSFSNRLACPSKQSSWEAQLATCKELCKLDLVDMRFAASAAAEGASCENASFHVDDDDDDADDDADKRKVHPRASKAVSGDQGRSGRDEADGKDGQHGARSSHRNPKEGSSSCSSSQKPQPSRKRNFSAYRFDCKDENGRDMGMGYFSMGAALSSSSPSLSSPPSSSLSSFPNHSQPQAHPHLRQHSLPRPQCQPQRNHHDDSDNDKPVAVVSRENFAKFRVRTDSDASSLLSTATATGPRRTPHAHVHPRLSPWTSRRGRIRSGGHLPGMDDDDHGDDDDRIFREYQKSAFLMSRLTVKSTSPDLRQRGGAAATSCTSSSSSPSLLARNANHLGKGNDSWSGNTDCAAAEIGHCSENVAMTAAATSKADSSKAAALSSSFGTNGVMMHPIPTTLHALSNLKKQSKEKTRLDCHRSGNNNVFSSSSRMTSSSSSSFFVLHRNTKKTVRPHARSNLNADVHRHHDHCHIPLSDTATITATNTEIHNDREVVMPKLRNFVKHASSREEATQEFVQAYIRTLQVRNHANMM